jgi:hypothetical protein
MALGGFNECLDINGAQIDFAWAIDVLELQCCADWSEQRAMTIDRQRTVHSVLQQLASISVAYEVGRGGFGCAVLEFVRGCLSGHPMAAYAWSTGLLSVPRHSPAVRMTLAREHLARDAQSRRLNGQHQVDPRRAA